MRDTDVLVSALGIDRVDKLYLQLLFQCNFSCGHCFHGEDLKRGDAWTLEQVIAILILFRQRYGTTSVCFLGGEPLLHRDLPEILQAARAEGFTTEVCTNGYKRIRVLESCVPYLDKLRVSVDGTRAVHDALRRIGSFDAAMATVRWAASRGLDVGVTCTVTSRNANTVRQLAEEVVAAGASELVLHRLRLIGNAAAGDVADVTDHQASRVVALLEPPPEGLRVLVDSDLLESPECELPSSGDRLARAELAPDGRMYLSCKAVGSKANAFRFDHDRRELVLDPSPANELAAPIPQVAYV